MKDMQQILQIGRIKREAEKAENIRKLSKEARKLICERTVITRGIAINGRDVGCADKGKDREAETGFLRINESVKMEDSHKGNIGQEEAQEADLAMHAEFLAKWDSIGRQVVSTEKEDGKKRVETGRVLEDGRKRGDESKGDREGSEE